jgi:hypothetical protein
MPLTHVAHLLTLELIVARLRLSKAKAEDPKADFMWAEEEESVSRLERCLRGLGVAS